MCDGWIGSLFRILSSAPVWSSIVSVGHDGAVSSVGGRLGGHQRDQSKDDHDRRFHFGGGCGGIDTAGSQEFLFGV